MSAPTVARLSSPGEILAVLPSLCGFRPDESLVLLSLRGARRRVGLTARVDLPDEDDEAAVALTCAGRMAGDGASAVVLAVHSEQGRRDGFVERVRQACARQRIEVLEALHVQDGRWTSYSCRAACCPPSGTPLPTTFPALELVAAQQVASGRVVLASREQLVASVAPPAPEQRSGVRARRRRGTAPSTTRPRCSTASRRAARSEPPTRPCWPSGCRTSTPGTGWRRCS